MTTSDYPTEVWRDIPDYEGLYQASDQGRIYNVVTGRIIGKKPKYDSSYVAVHLRKNGRLVRAANVHQLVMETFVGECPEGMEVHHKNDVKHDNRLENLEYITHRDNIRKAVESGKLPRHSRQTKNEVMKLYDMGWLPIKIADYLGITHQRVSQILKAVGIQHRKEKPRRPAAYQRKPKRAISDHPHINHMVQAYRNGASTTEIARELGVLPAHVSNLLSRWLPDEERRNKKRTRAETQENIQRILELHGQGYTQAEIGEMCGSLPSYVFQVLKRHGLTNSRKQDTPPARTENGAQR